MPRHLSIALIAALIPGATPAAELIPGPMIKACVVSVYDGDTMIVDAKPCRFASIWHSLVISNTPLAP